MTEGLDQPATPESPQDGSAALSARSISRAEGVDAFQALQRVLYRSAKQDPERRFHALYDKLTRRDVMWRAWVDVATNQGAPGVDGVSIASIEEGGVEAVRAFLDELAAELDAETYRPRPLRRVNIPKPGQPGKTRPLSIPCVRDRVVMAAAKSVLEPIFEADFLPCSFGFRPKRSAHQALEVVRTTANAGAVWVLDADISDCFGSLAFDAIVSQVEKRVSDRKMLKLIRAWLRVGVLEGGVVTEQVAGAPQGSPVSPLLANIVLHVLDEAWRRQGQGLGTLVRYCDDFVVLAPTRARVVEAKARIEAILAPLGLHLHPDKTRISCLQRGQEGFVFLGFEHRMRESGKRRGHWYLNKWPSPRAMASIRAKVKRRTTRNRASWPLGEVVDDLNPVLRGWCAYFAVGNSSAKFHAVDSYVHERMARLASTKYGLHGRNWATRFTYGWMTDLGIYRLSGKVRYYRAASA
ncbi:MAG: group II intron reverse transcriptase/maturase [Acidimicrobiales bacterium]